MKLLATDMDGTILDADNRIPKESRELILELYQHDILTCFVTGRMWKSPAWYARQFPFPMPLISCNGGVVHDDQGEILSHRPLPMDVVAELIDECVKSEAFFQCYNLDALYLSGYARRTLRRYATDGEDFTFLQAPVIIDRDPLPRLQATDDLPVKFVIMDTDLDKLQQIRDRIEQRPGVQVSKSHFANLEITAEGATKGTALRLLANHLRIKKEDITVIGDNENDIPMFAEAGFSIGVLGGAEQVPEAADAVAAPPEEGGWAKAVRKYVLERRS